jgi:hypothetical protein
MRYPTRRIASPSASMREKCRAGFCWTAARHFADMRRQPLAFTQQDIELIHLGLAWRAARVSQPAMTMNTEAEAVTDRLEH